MKRSCGLIVITILLIFSVHGKAMANDSGYIAYIDSNVVVIEHIMGYVCAELYSYNYMNLGDTVSAKNLNQFGMIKIYDNITRQSNDVYVDEYWVDREKANEWIRMHGRPR